MKNDVPALVAGELIASIAARGDELRDLITDVEQFLSHQQARAQGLGDMAQCQRLADADPFGWLDQAKRSLQAGLMFAERAVAQPAAF